MGFQGLYSSLDMRWLPIRVLLFLLSPLVVIFILVRNPRQPIVMRWGRHALISATGAVFGLIVFYGYSCCDSPVGLYLGFPFSWLRGITSAQHYLPLPTFQYLVSNIFQIQWSIDAFSLIADILFWFSISLALVSLRSKKILMTPKQGGLQNI